MTLPGIIAIHRLRVRHSGAETFVDMTLDVPRSATFEEAHLISMRVENTIEALIPRSDVIVHIEPVVKDSQSLMEEVRSVAARDGLRIHGIRAHDVMEHLSLEMHVEIPANMPLTDAHELVSQLEKNLEEEIEALSDVVTHIEPVGGEQIKQPVIQIGSEELQRSINNLAEKIPEICDCHELRIHSDGKEFSLTFHCHMVHDLTVSQAHQITIELESQLRRKHPELGRIVIHTEPYMPDHEPLNGQTLSGKDGDPQPDSG
jgi:divalent metal cation (Fe/Co/Zn/Cd) transporter